MSRLPGMCAELCLVWGRLTRRGRSTEVSYIIDECLDGTNLLGTSDLECPFPQITCHFHGFSQIVLEPPAVVTTSSIA